MQNNLETLIQESEEFSIVELYCLSLWKKKQERVYDKVATKVLGLGSNIL